MYMYIYTMTYDNSIVMRKIYTNLNNILRQVRIEIFTHTKERQVALSPGSLCVLVTCAEESLTMRLAVSYITSKQH